MWGSASNFSAQYTDAPDSKIHGADMGPIWGWQDPGGPHVGPMNFAIWGYIETGQQFAGNIIHFVA